MRNRIKELKFVKARDLAVPGPGWRRHPSEQRETLRAVLESIGFADALLARENGGKLEIIDGRLRAELAADEVVPVLVVDLDDREALELQLVLDPLAGKAEPDEKILVEILESFRASDAIIENFINETFNAAPTFDDLPQKPEKELKIPELYQIVVECEDETQQRELYERLDAEGFNCRLVNF